MGSGYRNTSNENNRIRTWPISRLFSILVGTICRICGKTRRDLINRYVTNDVAVGNVCVEFLGGLPTTFSYGKALSGGSSPYAYPNTYQLLPAAHDRNRTLSWHAKDKKLNPPIIPKKKANAGRKMPSTLFAVNVIRCIIFLLLEFLLSFSYTFQGFNYCPIGSQFISFSTFQNAQISLRHTTSVKKVSL